MYLLMSPSEDTPLPTLEHNALFMKGLWQLELASMKFESLLQFYGQWHSDVLEQQKKTNSASAPLAGLNSSARAKLAQQAKISSGATKNKDPSSQVDFDSHCRLCALAGPMNAHHQTHGTASNHGGALRVP